MIEWSKDLVLHRMNRARDTMEDARILANAGRWNACVNRLYYACFYVQGDVGSKTICDGNQITKHN